MIVGKFSKFEDNYIIENYHDNRDVDLAKRLNRSSESVRVRRKRLGLHKKGTHVTEHLNSDYRVNLEIRALESYTGTMGAIASVRLSELKKKKVNIPHIRYREKVPLETKAKSYELYCSGMTIREVAKVMERNKSVIGEWIKIFKPYTGSNAISVPIKSKIWK